MIKWVLGELSKSDFLSCRHIPHFVCIFLPVLRIVNDWEQMGQTKNGETDETKIIRFCL